MCLVTRGTTVSPDRDRLEELRDLALRDLAEVDRQVSAGELSSEDAEELRRRYEHQALTALNRLQALSNTAQPASAANGGGATPAKPRTAVVTSRRVLYVVGIAVAVSAAFLVQRNLLDRPAGGFVTGNEVLQTESQPAPAPRDLSKVTDKELEAVVEANPDVLGMRLALARRYLDDGRYDLAVVHYTKVLEKEPKNPEALTHLGWVMFQVGRPEQGAELVDQAVEADPELADAWWVQASIRLYGLKDPGAAISSLDRLRGRTDLGPAVQRQIDQLRAKALRMLERRQ